MTRKLVEKRDNDKRRAPAYAVIFAATQVARTLCFVLYEPFRRVPERLPAVRLLA